MCIIIAIPYTTENICSDFQVSPRPQPMFGDYIRGRGIASDGENRERSQIERVN
jgi:hypothetical protein